VLRARLERLCTRAANVSVASLGKYCVRRKDDKVRASAQAVDRNQRMIHGGDIIEEVATKRRGKVNGMRGSIVNGQEVVSDWQVQFSDGKEPVIKLFSKEEDLQLVTCPHQTSEPGFYPAESIMDSY